MLRIIKQHLYLIMSKFGGDLNIIIYRDLRTTYSLSKNRRRPWETSPVWSALNTGGCMRIPDFRYQVQVSLVPRNTSIMKWQL